MASTAAPPRRTSWGNVNSRNFIKSYDKSPISSPKASPPSSPPISRNNSTASINSFRSEPAWTTSRPHSDSSAYSAKPRQDSTASQASVQSTASHKKGGFMGGLFHKATKEEKEEKKKHTEKIILGSRHAAAVKTKMALDPTYREFQEKNRKPSVPTAGITGGRHSSHLSAAEQEARLPHSGPPQLHVSGGLDMPSLTRIESHDEADSDEDVAERIRREWNAAPEHNMAEIPEVRSRHSSTRPSPWASPLQSRETSPNRTSYRGSIAGHSIGGNSIGGTSINGHNATGHKKHSYAGGYHRDEGTGRWTRKTPPQHTQHHPQQGGVNADLLAASLAERLNTTA